MLAKSTTRSFTSGTAATAVAKTSATAALFSCDRLALGHGDDRDVGVEGADAVGVDELLLRVVPGLTGQREVERPPVTELAGGEHAAEEQQHPHSADDPTMMHDQTGKTLHSNSWIKMGNTE